jgi:hypothetical protein
MSEQNETIFASGFVFKRPHDNAPQFVKGSMSIKADEAIAFIQKHTKPDGWVNLDLLASKDNTKLYFKLNTFKPEKKEEGIAPEHVPF